MSEVTESPPGAAGPRIVHWPCSCRRALQVPREMAEDVIECPWCARLTSFRGPRPEFECRLCRQRFPVYANSGEPSECPRCVLSRRLRRFKEASIVLLIGLAAVRAFYLFYFLGIR